LVANKSQEVLGKGSPKECEKAERPSRPKGQRRVLDNLSRVQISVSPLISLPDTEKQTPRNKYTGAAKKCPSNKADKAHIEIRSPILKPGALPSLPRSKLHASFFGSNSAEEEGPHHNLEIQHRAKFAYLSR